MKHLFLIIVVSFSAFGLLSQTEKSDQTKVNEILAKHKINPDHMSFQIRRHQQVLAEIQPTTQKIPASVTKILTAFAVLKTFDLNQKFKTQLYIKGQDLYLKGGGDTSFVSENMWYLVNVFIRSGIKKINHIYVDDQLFDQIRFDESRQSIRVDRSYDSPVGAMSFNWNSVNIFVKPTSIGKQAQVVLDPENNYYKLVNKTQTQSKIKKELIIDVDQKSRVITVIGDVKLNAEEKAYYKNVSNPEIWSGENLAAFLKQRGVAVEGQIKPGKVPSDATLVAENESKPLDQILADMNKFSNNYVAEMLTKHLAENSGEAPATLKTGMKMIQKQLFLAGLKNSEFNIENPSGFTRNNKISAQALNQVLFSAQNDFKIFPALLFSLPISGNDGTLKKRMTESPMNGIVRAKTGYLDGVISLSGYLGRPDGDILHFTFLYNGPQDMRTVQEAFDQVLETFVK